MTRGYVVTHEDAAGSGGRLTSWEAQIADSIATATEFWGFKRNHGRVWSLLYLRAEPMSSGAMQEALDLSKGAISMITRELEGWGVIHRVRETGQPGWRFVAETDLMTMIRRVLTERESGLIARIKADLAAAEETARDDGASAQTENRIRHIRKLTEKAEKAMDLFLKTGHFDLIGLLGSLNPKRG